jgi:hypothetical protein
VRPEGLDKLKNPVTKEITSDYSAINFPKKKNRFLSAINGYQGQLDRHNS